MNDTKPATIKSINIHEAKTNLSRIVEEVKQLGQPVIIAKSGVPQVKLVPLDSTQQTRKMGTLKGVIQVPDDFDVAFADEIQVLFNGSTNDLTVKK